VYQSSVRSTTASTAKSALAFVAVLSLLLSLFAIARPVIANHLPPDGPEVSPTAEEFPGGDPICPAGSVGIRFNNPAATNTQTVTLADGSVATVTIVSVAGNALTFTVDGGLAAIVKVKGGVSTPGVDDQNVYDYRGLPGGGIAHDDGLVTPNDQGISHVDFCLVPLPDGSILIYKDDQTGSPVQGATFSVKNDADEEVGVITTGADGFGCIDDLDFGDYTVTETAAPDGWLPDPDTEMVTVDSASTCDERLTDAAPEDADATFTNTLLGSLLVLKTDDGQPAMPLEGADFTVTGPDSFEQMASSDANGWFCIDGLVFGAEYTVTETDAPDGFVVDTNNPQTHVIDDTDDCATRTAALEPAPDLTFVNTEQPTGSITINKEIECEECETRTPGFWFNAAGSHDDETNALMAELAAADGGSNASAIEVNIDGTVYLFATAQDVRDFVEADRSGDWDGERGLSRDGALLRHYLSTWLNVALNGEECDLLARELGGQTVEEILAEAAAALEADDEAAEVEALEKLTAINESDDAEENPLSCGDSEGTAADGFTFELFAEADFPDGDPIDSGTTGDDGAGTLVFDDLPLGTYVLVETGNENEQECEIVSVDGGVLNEDGTVTVEVTEETPDVVLTVVNECEGGGGEENPGDITVIKEAGDDTEAAFAFSASWDTDGFVMMTETPSSAAISRPASSPSPRR